MPRDDEPASRPPALRRAPRRRSWGQRFVLGGGIGVVVVVLLLAGAIAVGAAKLSNIAREDVDLAEALQGEPENYLVVGSDSRAVVKESDPDASAFLGGVGAEPTGQRSDTILVVRVDPRADQVQVLSLPRDLWVPIAGTGENDRINAAYALGGAQRLVDTIREDFGIEIHHYLEVDFASFKGVVDAVGGVPMWFDTRMRDTNSGLVIDKPGCHTLDGEAALAFARSRHLQYDEKGRWVDDPTGDLGRISRQQYLIRRMFDLAAAKVRSIDVRGTNDLIDAGTRNLTVDRQLDVKKLVALSRKLSSGSADEVLVTHSLPSIQWATPGGASVLKMHPAEAQPILNVFRGLPADTIPPSEVRFSVLNATGTRARAAAIKDDFRPTGFVVTATEETGGTNTRSVVKYGPGNLRMAQEVARHLVGGADLAEDDDLNERIMLIAGKDYAGVTTDARPLDQLTTTTTTSSSSSRSGSSSSSGRSQSSTSTTAPTTTTTAALGDGLGQVPGRPPEGVTCS